jgi:hypothetical protein
LGANVRLIWGKQHQQHRARLVRAGDVVIRRSCRSSVRSQEGSSSAASRRFLLDVDTSSMEQGR